ncbi:hypothetical protein L2E82_15659 [Cichorium intybus]|uniref:Uncharacterized protein n=1 Tax=Cichorium intybus TaxID=13427 RepID=A0ACB9F3Y9_CICIN|nr:hypothetical protein L2E82_15659 [Cichorium intybus]
MNYLSTFIGYSLKLKFDYKTSKREQQHSLHHRRTKKNRKPPKKETRKEDDRESSTPLKLCESNRQRIQVFLFSTASSSFLENGRPPPSRLPPLNLHLQNFSLQHAVSSPMKATSLPFFTCHIQNLFFHFFLHTHC